MQLKHEKIHFMPSKSYTNRALTTALPFSSSTSWLQNDIIFVKIRYVSILIRSSGGAIW